MTGRLAVLKKILDDYPIKGSTIDSGNLYYCALELFGEIEKRDEMLGECERNIFSWHNSLLVNGYEGSGIEEMEATLQKLQAILGDEWPRLAPGGPAQKPGVVHPLLCPCPQEPALRPGLTEQVAGLARVWIARNPIGLGQVIGFAQRSSPNRGATVAQTAAATSPSGWQASMTIQRPGSAAAMARNASRRRS